MPRCFSPDVLGRFIFALTIALSGGSAVAQSGIPVIQDPAVELDGFGHAVALGEDVIYVGNHDNSSDPVGDGIVYAYARSGGDWVQVARLMDPATTHDSQFGYAVAAQGDEVVVGAPQSRDENGAPGAAFVLRRTGPTTWAQVARLTVPAGETGGGHFGHAVAIDGDVIAIGGPRAGAVYVYHRDGMGWRFAARLTGDQVPNSFISGFGEALALDGDRLAVGAPESALNGQTYIGGVFLFDRAGEAWTLDTCFVANHYGGNFGASVDVQGDRVLVGSWYERNGDGMGGAYVYTRTGGRWEQQAHLLSPEADEFLDQEQFGIAVAFHDDLAVVGELRWDADQEGHVYAFRPAGDGWVHTATLQGQEGELDLFGTSLAVNGSVLVVGAPEHSGTGWHTGTAYTFDPAVLVAAEPAASPATGSALHLAPNPAVDRTAVRYTVASPGRVHVGVYDVLGREVLGLVEGVQGAGSHEVTFDVGRLPAGTYVVRVRSGDGARGTLLTVRR